MADEPDKSVYVSLTKKGLTPKVKRCKSFFSLANLLCSHYSAGGGSAAGGVLLLSCVWSVAGAGGTALSWLLSLFFSFCFLGGFCCLAGGVFSVVSSCSVVVSASLGEILKCFVVFEGA